MSVEVDFNEWGWRWIDIMWENKCPIYIGTNKEFGCHVREEDS